MVSSLFLAFLGTVFIINISPGPAMMFTLHQSQTNGLKSGLLAALGVECGVFIYVILTALGIAAFFSRYPTLYMIFQLTGAFYLLYLAYKSWPRAGEAHKSGLGAGGHKAFLKGLLINLTNPKIVLFFISLIPQFVPPASGPERFILYGLIFNAGGLTVNLSVALLANTVSQWLKNARWFDYVPPLLFTAISFYTIISRLMSL
ncbi:LysE family translocator [Acetobacteraceae bacterium ESL0709]|nr:LysE family translocator [Acetobacteraceae bacterium ESL0697]MDF7677626.1 LysE family translocator [Acetobacteraceae bacterium ESL0709]